MNRQRLLLAVLVGLLILSLVYAFWAMPRQEQVPPRAAGRAPMKAAEAGRKGPPAADRLHLELLTEAPQAFPGAGRDIFRFRGGWAPPVVEMVLPEPPVPEPQPPPPPPTPEQLLRDKVKGFVFLGFLDKGGVRTVFLSGDGEVYLVKAGDRFGRDGELVAREIDEKELVVGSADIAEVVRVRLMENEALTPTIFGGGGAASARPTADGSSLRTRGITPPLRRGAPPRAVQQNPPVPNDITGDATMEEPLPDDGAIQEGRPKQGLPDGEGDGNSQ